MITSGSGQRRNIWFDAQEDIQEFTASFTYHAANSGFGAGMGASFIIQNDPAGLGALTDSEVQYGFAGIENSAGITFELHGAFGTTHTGFYRNGIIGDGAADVAPHQPNVGDGLDVTIDYNGSLLTVLIDDGVNDPPFSRNYLVSPALEDSLSSGNAFVGFGAATPSTSGITQTISNFRFSAVPEPSSVIMVLPVFAILGLLRDRRLKTCKSGAAVNTVSTHAQSCHRNRKITTRCTCGLEMI